ncbi:hypothetical protein BU14_0427s0023 [Porphyra umbilicalis]|uniref:t-SNARE coiled-coil homology domain-containing protein n=1 Tax=Porphyra umbilicalis TaxID=2786 RepID=A0A1X6NVY1_PORUM|nr:hypothetical protein BU14_0427s0023 [Porphyra umbilicalis]|eukprot:OSX72533.1 hypothetical protein BU14_0427s0023 [Porphyra umbilicalis]
MFKKKNKGGGVTMLDEPAGGSSAAAAPPADSFDDLLDDAPAAGRGRAAAATREPTAAEMDQMSVAELEEMALAQAAAGNEGTKRSLALALEARTIGVTTAATLKDQTKQLEGMTADIERVHDCLDKSEKVIDKMTKPVYVRMFTRSKRAGKGLDKQKKLGRKEAKERAAMREGGVDSLDLDGLRERDAAARGEGGRGPDEEDDDRAELLDEQLVASKKGKAARAVGGAAGVGGKEEYAGYSTGVATALRKQDEDLDAISGALADMKGLASAMNSELTYQEGLVSTVNEYTLETSRRTKANAAKVKTMLK